MQERFRQSDLNIHRSLSEVRQRLGNTHCVNGTSMTAAVSDSRSQRIVGCTAVNLLGDLCHTTQGVGRGVGTKRNRVE